MLKPLWIAGMPGALFDRVTHFCGKNPDALTEKISQVQLRLALAARGESSDASSELVNLAEEVLGLLPESAGGRKKADTKFFFAEPSLAWTYGNWDSCLAGSYLLFYQSPLVVLRDLFGQSESPNLGESLRLAMQDWLSYHEKFLEIFHAHPKKALLLRLDGTTKESIAALRKKLEGSKSFAKGILPEAFFGCLLDDERDSVQDPASDEAFLLAMLAQAYPECYQLFLSLEAVALAVTPKLKEPAEQDFKTLSLWILEQQLALKQLMAKAQAAAQQVQASEERLEEALSEQLKAQKQSEALLIEQQNAVAQLDALAKEKAQCTADKQEQLDLLKKRDQQLIDVKSELEVALLQLHQLQESYEAEVQLQKSTAEKLALAEKEKNSLLAEQVIQAASLEKSESRTIELQNESELMLLQLHQVQEECEAQFLLQKTSAGKLELLEQEKKLLLADQKRQADLLVHKEAEIVDLRNSKELMLTQLHQVQEECEAQFLLQKTSAGKLELLEQEKKLLLADQKRQADLLANKETQIVDLKNSKELILTQLHQAQKDCELQILAQKKLVEKQELSEKEKNVLLAEQKRLMAQLVDKEARIGELQSDGELMLLQLHQVQEELELYFLECERARGLLESYRQSERNTRQLLTDLMKPHLATRA